MDPQKPIPRKSYFTARNINPVIRILSLSGILIVSGFGFITPIFAIFITKNIEGGTVEAAGIAMAVYMLTKSLGQIPAATMLDSIKGEKDDFWAIFFGSIVYACVPLLYILVSKTIHLYLIQFIYGLASAFVWPAWNAVFTRHIDHDREGVEWGIYYTLTDLGSAAAAMIGGFVAYRFGFAPLFLLVSSLVFLGALMQLMIHREMRTGGILFRK